MIGEVRERTAGASKTVWKKVLYEDFGVADNYTDNTFLQELRTNINLNPISFKQSIIGSLRITTYLSVVFIFLSVYFLLENGAISLINISVVSAAIYFTLPILSFVKNSSSISVRDSIIYLGISFALPPVLKTLTESTSTDSIYAICSLQFLLHLFSIDYGKSYVVASKQISLSTSLCAAICLASRLPSHYHVFSLLTIANTCFAIFPHVYTLSNYSEFVGGMLIFVSLLCQYYSDSQLFVLGVVAFILLNLVMPYLFVKSQKFKTNIYGPWDEPVI